VFARTEKPCQFRRAVSTLDCEYDLERAPPVFAPGEEMVADSAAGFFPDFDRLDNLHPWSGSSLAVHVSGQVKPPDAMASANAASWFDLASGHLD
jgi:hypothetical protein